MHREIHTRMVYSSIRKRRGRESGHIFTSDCWDVMLSRRALSIEIGGVGVDPVRWLSTRAKSENVDAVSGRGTPKLTILNSFRFLNRRRVTTIQLACDDQLEEAGAS